MIFSRTFATTKPSKLNNELQAVKEKQKMDENEIEILGMENRSIIMELMSKKGECGKKMPGSKPNVGQKRRRPTTPMRPVPIAPKTNILTRIKNVELGQSLGIKNEPGFITFIPKANQTPPRVENEDGKPIIKIDHYDILESFTGVENTKRMKLESEQDVPMHYIIVQNQNSDNGDAVLIASNSERDSNQQKTNSHEYTIVKSDNCINDSLQQCDVNKPTQANTCETVSLLPKLRLAHGEQISLQQDNEKNNFNSYKNYHSVETLSHCSATENSNNVNDIARAAVSGNTNTQNEDMKLDSSNMTSLAAFDALGSLKSRSQKPIVIMQQLLSPPNRTNIVKTKQVPIQGLNKLTTVNIQDLNMETRNTSEEASPRTSNESFYDTKTICNQNATRLNNYEHDNDFLLKKEFPIISSSQVDSVLKAIDMQGLNKGISSNEAIDHVKKRTGDKDAHDGRSLPGIQGAARLSTTGNTQHIDTVVNMPTELQTNRPMKRFESGLPAENYSKAVEKLTVTLQCYKCKDCSYMSLDEKHIFEHIEKEHIDIFENKEKLVLRCPGCSNTFRHRTSLLSHIVHDHQVHESEARIMTQQICLRQNFHDENEDDPKPISQIRITKTQNEQIYVTQTLNTTLFEDNERPQSVSPALPSPAHSEPQLLENDIIDVENEELHSIQDINDMPVVVDDSAEGVDIVHGMIPFTNEEQRTLPIKLYDNQLNKQVKVNLIDPKNIDQKFEFINFKNDNGGESYLREDDMTERRVTDSDSEFVTPSTVELIPANARSDDKAVKLKRKGKSKGSKSPNKPQPVRLKQGFKCEFENCVVRMLVQENIVYHQKCHANATAPSSVSFQCPECLEFRTNIWNNMAVHLWRAHIVDMELHSCDLCGYKTPSLSNLANQHRGIHGDDRPFLCDNCGKGFKTTKQLRNHRALHRAKDKEPIKCDRCKRNFTNRRLLKLHRDSVHRDTKPFTCSACSYSASTRSALKLHMRRHTGEKPFACEQCSYSTGDHNSLRRHKLRHLGLKPYSCPHCSYACIQSSTYKVHLKKKHPGLDHDLMFSCQYCSFKSIKKENLLTHMAKHDQVADKITGDSESPILVE